MTKYQCKDPMGQFEAFEFSLDKNTWPDWFNEKYKVKMHLFFEPKDEPENDYAATLFVSNGARAIISEGDFIYNYRGIINCISPEHFVDDYVEIKE